MTKKTVHFHHDRPVVLRVDEMVDVGFGIKEARLLGEIPLASGRNEVDADLFDKWKQAHSSNPMAKLIVEENEKEDENG